MSTQRGNKNSDAIRILQRDREYEAGEAKSYSLDEVIAYFNVAGK